MTSQWSGPPDIHHQTISIFNKSKIYQRPDIKDNDQRYQLVPCYNVSKRLVSFRCELKRLLGVLSWSVSLRYQLVNRYNVSLIGQFHLRTSETLQRRLRQVCLTHVPVETSQHGPGRSNWSLKWVNFFWVLGSTFLRHLRQFSLFKVPASTLLQRLKDASLIQVPVVTSLSCVKLVSLTQVSIGMSL